MTTSEDSRPAPVAYPAPPLADAVVRLRRWQMSDLPCIQEASRDPVIPAGTTVPPEYSETAGRAFVERQWSRADRGEGLSLAVTDAATDTALGAIVLLARDTWVAPGTTPAAGSAALGYWVLAQARGRGLASRAVALLARWAVQEGGLARVEALVETHNVASQRVLARAGFQQEGLLRSYLVFRHGRADALMFSLLPADLPSS